MGLCQGCEAPPGFVVDLPNLVSVHELDPIFRFVFKGHTKQSALWISTF